MILAASVENGLRSNTHKAVQYSMQKAVRRNRLSEYFKLGI